MEKRKFKTGKLTSLERFAIDQYIRLAESSRGTNDEWEQELADMLNRPLEFVKKKLPWHNKVKVKLDGKKLIEDLKPEVEEKVKDEVVEKLRLEVENLKTKLAPEPPRQAVTGERAKNLLGRREGIVVMTPAASEEFDHQSNTQTSRKNQDCIFKPGKPNYDGSRNFDTGSRY